MKSELRVIERTRTRSQKKLLLFKNALIDVFKNWVQFLILIFLVFISAGLFTLMWTTSARMESTNQEIFQSSNLHDAVLEENFVYRNDSASNPLNGSAVNPRFDDHGVNSNYVQRALTAMNDELKNKYANLLNKNDNFFDFDRRETRVFGKTINNHQYLFKLVAYGQDTDTGVKINSNHSELTDSYVGDSKYVNKIDNLINAATKTKIANNLLIADDSKSVTKDNPKLGYYTVVLSQEFMLKNKLHNGDLICPTTDSDNSLKCTKSDLDPLNKASVPLRVVGSGYSADLLYPMLDPTTVLPNSNYDGVVYVNPWLFGLAYERDDNVQLAKLNPYYFWEQQVPDKISLTSIADKEVYYSIKFNINVLKQYKNPSEILNSLAKKYFILGTGNDGKFIYDKSDSAYRFFNRVHMSNIMISVYVSLLSTVIGIFMIICLGIMIILIKKQISYAISKIACLKALGYYRREIYSSYLSYPLIVGLFGGLIGYLIGLVFHPFPIAAFQKYFMAEFNPFTFDATSFLFSILALTSALILIVSIYCLIILSKDFLELNNELQNIKIICAFQKFLNKINPRSSFKVRFHNAIFSKSFGKICITFFVLFIGTSLITVSILAPRSLYTMMMKTYFNQMKYRAGETYYDLPLWNNPFSIYRLYNVNNKLPGDQNVSDGDISVYNYEPFHFDKDVVNYFNNKSLIPNLHDAGYMASVGAANLPNSNWQIYDKNYLTSLDNTSTGAFESGATEAGKVAIAEYAPALSCAQKYSPDQWKAKCLISPDDFANKFKILNAHGGYTYFSIYYPSGLVSDRNREISSQFIKDNNIGDGVSAESAWDKNSKNYLQEMPINQIIKEGMLTRSPWFVRDRLLHSDQPYGEGFGLIPFNSKTDELALHFSPLIKNINNHILAKPMRVDGYGIDVNSNLDLHPLFDIKNHNLSEKLLNSNATVNNGKIIYPVVINQTIAKELNVSDNDTITINPDNKEEMIEGKSGAYKMDPFANRSKTPNKPAYDVDYSTIDFNENSTINTVLGGKGLIPNSKLSNYSSDDEINYHLSRQIKMASIKQSALGGSVGDYGDNFNGSYYDENLKTYVQSHTNPDLLNDQIKINSANGTIIDKSQPGVPGGWFNSYGSEYQTGSGKMVYKHKLYESNVHNTFTLKIIGVDDSYGQGSLFILNHNNYQAKSELEDKNYAEQILQFNKTKDYLAPIFIEQINGKVNNSSDILPNIVPFSPVVQHYWQVNGDQEIVNESNMINPTDPNLINIKSIHSGIYYQLSSKLRKIMNYMYPIYNAKFTKSSKMDDVLSNLNVLQREGDYSRLSMGGGYEFGSFANLNILYPQYAYSALQSSGLLSQEYAVMNNFVSLIMLALYFFITISLIICLMIILFTTNIIIGENKRLIATMKVLGYKNSNIISYVLGMYLPVILISLAAGILGGYFAFQTIIGNLSTLLGKTLVLPSPTAPWIFILIPILIIFIYLVSLVGNYFTLKRTSPVEALKSL